MEILSNGNGTYAVVIQETEYTVTRAELEDFISQAQTIMEDGL